jgi:hypothetical protein
MDSMRHGLGIALLNLRLDQDFQGTLLKKVQISTLWCQLPPLDPSNLEAPQLVCHLIRKAHSFSSEQF